MIKNAIPEVRELQLDYRKEVDRLLKMTCEAFIRESAHQVVGPLTSVIPKAVSFFLVKSISLYFLSNCEMYNFPYFFQENSASIKNHSSSVLNEKVTESMKNLKKVVPIIQQKMSLYLANKETEFILYKPIRVNILETFTRFSKITEENFDDQDLVVIACPNVDMLTVTLSSLSLNTV